MPEPRTPRNTLGAVSFQVLASILRLGNQAKALTIKRDMEDATKTHVHIEQLSNTLRPLSEKGWLSFVLEDKNHGRPGLPKKIYSVTEEGKALLTAFCKTLTFPP